MSPDILADALKALGINPDNDPIYHAKRWIEGRDADRRERDRMTTAHGDALARVGARDLRIKDLEAKIASNVAESAAREMRIADLERDLAAADLALDDRNAPRLADGAPLPVAARIRAIPC